MQKYSEIVATTKADGTVEVLPGATVTVYLTGTTTLASLYSDNGITAKANPFQSAALTGRIEFYAADGRYDIKIDKAGYTTVTVADILIEDPEDIGVLEDVTLVDATISTSTVTNSTLSQCILVNTEIQDVDSLQLTDTPPAVLQPRMLSWNNDEGTADLSLLDGTVLQMGQELHYRARNNTASTIADGAVVWATGTSGATGRINVGLAVADGSQPGKTVMGLMTHATAAGSDGYVANFGKVRGINTTGSAVGETWLNGDILYLHPTIPGALTKVKPAVNGNIVVTVAIVIYAGNNGTLFVRPTADSQEADEIRYTPAGTGAVATTVQAKLRETVSVKDFGATGDGVTDDTVAVQKCWDYCRTNNRTAFVPKGIYRIGQTNIAYGMSIIGDAGATFKLLDNQPKFTRMLTTENNPWVVTSQTEDSPLLSISGLTFDGNQSNQGPYSGSEKEQQQLLFLNGSGATNTNKRRLRAVVENCVFKAGCSDGIGIYRSVDLKVSNCFFWNMFRGSVVLTGANSVVEVDNISCGGDLWSSFIQSEIDGTVNGLLSSVMTVTNSFFDSLRDNASAGTGADFGMGAGSKLTVSNCVFNAGLLNLYMGDNTSVAEFSNCTFRQLTGSDNLVSPGVTKFDNCVFLNTTANTSGRLLSFRQFITGNHNVTYDNCLFDAEFDAQSALTTYSSGVTVNQVNTGVFDFDVGTAHGISAPGNYTFQMIVVSGLDQWQYNKAYWIAGVPTANSFRVNITENAGTPTSASGITVRVIADATKMVDAIYLNGGYPIADKGAVNINNCRFGKNIYSAAFFSNGGKATFEGNLFECANVMRLDGSGTYPSHVNFGQNYYGEAAGNLLVVQGNLGHRINFNGASVPARVANCRFYLGIGLVASELQSRLTLASNFQPNNNQQRLFWQDWSYSGASSAGVPLRYSNNGTSWFASGGTVAKGATASRPTLSSIDQGQTYLDTTLNANGKPITWTGSVWVDATGATV